MLSGWKTAVPAGPGRTGRSPPREVGATVSSHHPDDPGASQAIPLHAEPSVALRRRRLGRLFYLTGFVVRLSPMTGMLTTVLVIELGDRHML
jgi:hypothetical protein